MGGLNKRIYELREISRSIVERVLFNSRLYSRLLKRRHILCLGDSHIRVFNFMERQKTFKGIWFKVMIVGGATAQGLANPNSRTHALGIFSDRIRRAKPWQILVFQIGEVDCGFVIWYRSEKYELSVQSQLERSIAIYTSFLLDIRSKGFHQIYVMSAPLPTITDGQTWGDVANARREVTASQLKRTELTLLYNKMLKEFCDENSITFLDTSDQLLDKSTGLISPRFINHENTDHHLSNREYAKVIEPLVLEKLPLTE
jgi:hypothetical protein